MPRKIVSETGMMVNTKTGEVIAESDDIAFQISRRIEEDEDFVKTYVDAMYSFFKDKPAKSALVLYGLIKYGCMSYAENGQIVRASSFEKSQIAKDMDLDLRTIDNMIYKMARQGALKRVGRATYAVNPFIVSKGMPSAILKLRREWRQQKGWSNR